MRTRDPILWTGLLGAALCLVVGTLQEQLSVHWFSALWFEFALALWVLFGLSRRGPKLPAEERLFRRLLGAGWAIWAGLNLYSGVLADSVLTSQAGALIEDSGWALFYLCVLGALYARPDRLNASQARIERSRLRVLDFLGTLLVSTTLLAYFVWIPITLAPDEYWTWIPSLTMYVLFDGLVLFHLTAVRATTRAARWRSVYGWLLVGFVFALLRDGLEIAEALGLAHPTSFTNAFWLAPHCAVLIAARVGSDSTAGMESTGTIPSKRSEGEGWGRSLLVYALALPLLHLTLENFLGTATALDAPRDRLILVATILLGLSAALYERSLRGRSRHLAATQERITERLELSRRMEANGRLASGLAHDFQNLLQVIRSGSEALEFMEPTPSQKNCVREIKKAAERAEALTRKLLSLSRDTQEELQSVDVNELILDLGSMIRRVVGSNVEVDIRLSSSIDRVLTHRGQLEHALLNLAVNARDAMEGRGRLEIRTRWTPASEELPAHVQLEISDTGPGMTSEVRERAFEPFFTTKDESKGTGLGLSMVYNLVERSGGWIEIDSAPGEGTTFHLGLPTSGQDADDLLIPVCDPAATASAKSAPSQQGGTA